MNFLKFEEGIPESAANLAVPLEVACPEIIIMQETLPNLFLGPRNQKAGYKQ